MARSGLAQLRHEKHWTLGEASERIGVSVNTLSRWEHGIQRPHGYNLQCLSDAYGIPVSEIEALLSKEDANLQLLGVALPIGGLAGLNSDDPLALYMQGIATCRDLQYSGNVQAVENILPLYCQQTATLAQQPSPLQQRAALLASLAQRTACSIATDHEDYGTAQRTGQQALLYAQTAGDANLQTAALISLANLGFHRKLSTAALHACNQAIALFEKHEVTPLLKGRVYAVQAEVYAMRQDLQAAMRAMGKAYEVYPEQPELDPAYPYLRASRYALYVFGDLQPRLFLGQAREAEKALIAMQGQTNDPEIEPLSYLDLLYYRAAIQAQQQELEASCALLQEAALLAKKLGSRLYFNKLALSYHDLQRKWPKETAVITLEEAFQPW